MYTDQQIQNLVAELSRNLVALFGNAIESAGLSIDNLGDETPDEEVASALVTAHTTAAKQAIELVTLFSALPEISENEAWQTASSMMVSSFSAFIDGVETPGTNLEKLQKVVDFVNLLGELPVPYTGAALGDTELGKFFGRAGTVLTRFEMLDAFRDGDYSRLATTIAMCAVGYAVDAIIIAGLAAIGAVSWPFLIIGAGIACTVSVFFEDEIEEFFQSQFENEEAAFVIEQYTRLYGGEFANFDSINAVAQVGTAGADISFGLAGRMNLIGGGAGEDMLVGNDLTDILGGGSGSDTLEGRGGDDILIAGDDDDILIGGAGNDSLEGGVGFDEYRFVASDFATGSKDVILDSDSLGKITFDGIPIGDLSVNNVSRDGFGWETHDRVFRLQVIGSGDDASLMIIHRETGSHIIVNNWSNGDLGITLPDLGQPGTPENPFPLTNGDDLIGFDGDDDSGTPVSSDDVISGLAGNDGIDGGYGDDWIDGGHDDDLLLGGPGSNRLIGGLGNDIIINYANVMGWAPWSNEAYGDQFDNSSNTISHGNGWLAFNDLGAADLNNAASNLLGLQVWAWGPADGNPQTEDIWVDLDPNLFQNGDDEIDAGDGSDTAYGGEGDDRIAGGTGNDLLMGGSDNDFVNGEDGDDLILGDDLTYGTSFFSYLATRISATADVSGNDVLVGGLGNDRISGQGGIDVIDGGEGDDILSGDRIDFVLGMAIDQPVASGNDTISGGAGNDWISGDGGDDTLSGGTGADIIFGDSTTLNASEHGNDIVKGDAGNDELYGGGGDDDLDGGADDDIVFGEDGNDRLLGGTGLDELIGGLGNDSLSGGAGNDKLWGDAGADRLDGGAGADELQGGEGADTLIGGEGDDKLWGDAGNDTASGGNGLDQIAGGDGNDTLDGGAGSDILNGNVGQDTLFGGGGNDNLSGNEDNDTVEGGDGDDYVGGDDGSDVLLGGAGNDNVFGGLDSDQISGGEGNDHLDGGAGADTLSGDQGNDTLIGGEGDDLLSGGEGLNTYYFDRQFGHDTVQLLTGSYDQLVFRDAIAIHELAFVKEGDDLLIRLDGSADELRLSGYFSLNTEALIGLEDGTTLTRQQILDDAFLAPVSYGTAVGETLQGTFEADRLYGLGGDDTLVGLTGDDLLDGGDGNDTLFGDGGDDVLIGGAGDDIYMINADGGFDVIQGLDAVNAGADIVELGAGISPSSVNVMIYGDDVHLSFSDSSAPTGVSGSAYLTDFMKGNHSIRFGNGTVWTRATLINQTLPPRNGTSGDDVMIGSDANDALNGLAGNDLLQGEGGNDALNGGDGIDILHGGAGNDVLRGIDGYDTLYGGVGDDTYYIDYNYANPKSIVIEYASEGYDQVVGNGSFTLADNVEKMISYGGIRNVVGNASDNLIVFNTSGSSVEEGSANGKEGADRYEYYTGSTKRYLTIYVDNVGDSWSALGSAAQFDLVFSANYNLTFDASIRNVTLTGSTAATITGDARGQKINSSGSTGMNSLAGLGGDDHYTINYDDIVIEAVGGGTDTVLVVGNASQSYTISENSNVENYIASGGLASITGSSAADVITIDVGSATKMFGGAGDDVLTGNAAANYLDGGTGNDVMSGGAGADSYYIDSLGDVVYETGIHQDIAYIAIDDYVAPGGVESVYLIGNALRAIGNADTNRLVGNALDNVLDGRGGWNDSLEGGAGADTYVFNRGYGMCSILDSGTDEVTDVLQFGEGILQADVSVFQEVYSWGVNYRLEVAGATGTYSDIITVVADSQGVASVEQLRFSDGSSATIDQLLSNGTAAPQAATTGDDVLMGSGRYMVPNSGGLRALLEGHQVDGIQHERENDSNFVQVGRRLDDFIDGIRHVRADYHYERARGLSSLERRQEVASLVSLMASFPTTASASDGYYIQAEASRHRLDLVLPL